MEQPREARVGQNPNKSSKQARLDAFSSVLALFTALAISSTADSLDMDFGTRSNIDVLKVLEYLSKKGYNRTEATLRMESAHQDGDGRPIFTRVEESGGLKYGKAFGMV